MFIESDFERNRVKSTNECINRFRLQIQSFVFKPIMDSLDNLPKDKHILNWVNDDLRNPLLFILSLLIILQTFWIFYQIAQNIGSFCAAYVCPLEVKETDLDQFDINEGVVYPFAVMDIIIE